MHKISSKISNFLSLSRSNDPKDNRYSDISAKISRKIANYLSLPRSNDPKDSGYSDIVRPSGDEGSYTG